MFGKETTEAASGLKKKEGRREDTRSTFKRSPLMSTTYVPLSAPSDLPRFLSLAGGVPTDSPCAWATERLSGV